MARVLLDGVTPEQAALRIESNRWSIAECLVHLNLTGQAFATVISEACEQGLKERILGDGPFKKDMRGSFRRWMTVPPARVKFRTSEQFEPSRIGSVEDILTTFLALQEQFENLVAGADGLDLSKITVTHPGSRYFHYNLFSCFEIVLAHELRHFWQAEHVRRALLDSLNRFTKV